MTQAALIFQLQQLQQQLQAAAVATASQQHQQTEQLATASGGLTLALHHTTGGGAGVLTPQLLLAPQTTPSFAAYPVTSTAQHTTSIQQVLQHHVRQSSILQSTIQQVGPTQTHPQTYTETNNGIIGNNKCIPVPPGSPFSSRSLTPSPQQRVLTPQPVFQQVMSATGPVLQLYQPATRTATVTAAAITPQPKNKPPQQILPKPITNIMTQTAIKPQPTQTNNQAGTLLLNQMIPNAGVIVGQQTSSGVQLILKSPSPQTISASVPKAQVVVSSNGSLSTSPNTVFVQANRSQPQQVVRLITGQSLQLQQVQTSSGPALVAVPSMQPTLQQTTSTHTATVVPSVAAVPMQTSVFNQNVIKKTTNHINSDFITNNQISNSNSGNISSLNSSKKKKRKEEETTKLDLANLIKISGIDEEDGAPVPTSVSSSTCSISSSLSSLSSSSSMSSSPPTTCTIQTQSPPVVAYQNQRTHIEQQTAHQFQSEQQSIQIQNHQKSRQFSSRPSTPKQNNTPLITQLQSPATQQCGLRFSIGEDGQVILQQPQIASQQSVTASVAAAAQTQLAQLVAEHGGHILQTAVLSLTGSESIVVKTPTGFAVRQPQMVFQQRASGAPNMVLASDTTSSANGVRILTDVGGLNGLAGKVQFVSGSTVQDHNRVQIVTGVQNPNTMSLTEQQRVQIVTAATTGVPDLSSMSLTTEQQNHVQILTSVPNATTEVSLTEQQQNRMEIISSEEQKNRVQVIPNSRTVSLTEQLVSDISQQILTNVPAGSNIHEQNTRLIFQNSNTGERNERVHISSSERTTTTDLHITSNVQAATATEQQTKVHMIANLPQNCSISLNEQNRYQIIPNAEYTLEEKSSHILDGKLMNAIAGEIRLSEPQKSQMEGMECASQQQANQRAENQNRFHVISNVDGREQQQQRFVQVNEEQNRIIVSSSIEHQRVLNTSTLSFNDQQNRIQIANANEQRLLQQLSDEQRKIQIFANQQQRVVQLNDHQKFAGVKGTSEGHEQAAKSQQSQSMPKITLVQMKDGTQHKLNRSDLEAKLTSNEVQEKLPTEVNTNSDHFRNDSSAGEEARLGPQYTNGKSCEAAKSRCANVNGTMHQSFKSPSSVISARCTPSPHSPHFNHNKSPSHHSPQATVVVSSQSLINSCFSNRPNLTVVAQSSPPMQEQMGGLPFIQVKPCAAVISHSNTSPANNVTMSQGSIVIDQHGNLVQKNATFLNNEYQERFVTPAMSSPQTVSPSISPRSTAQSSSPPISNQNSFLDSIAHSHPNISINKTGIVQPCSKPNVLRGKKPKKSAVVKPMVFQPEGKEKNDGPACLNPVSNDGTHSSVVQRVQTIQLTPQKQQSLKIVQSQIAVLSGKKTRTPTEQAALQKLFNEQQKILLSGKIIPTVPGQNTQGLTFVSTPVRLVPPPTTPPSPHPPSTPPTCNKATSPLHVQVGTQTTLDEPVPALVVPQPPATIPVPAVSVSVQPVPTLPLQPPSPTVQPPCTQSQLVIPSPTMIQQPQPVSPPSPPPPPKLTPAKRAALINEQFELDQRGATHPDTNTPFNSTSDACKRLLRYHCFDEPILSEKDLEKADEIFEATAKHLLDKNAQMLNKYSYLICKESMREVQTSELIMLGRMFVADETQLLDQMKHELMAANNPPSTCSIATQVDGCSSPVTLDDHQIHSCADLCAAGCQLEALIPGHVEGGKMKREYDCDEDDRNDVKKHCPDDEEINAQVQSAIDSILNLQRSDPATDEAVRSILPS